MIGQSGPLEPKTVPLEHVLEASAHTVHLYL